MQRESMEFDVVIVGGGPAGLAAAIRFGQLNQQHNTNYTICVVEKGSEIGAHILSGAVLEPKALNELIPDWQTQGAPLNTPVKTDQFMLLTQKSAWHLPTPPQMNNHGNYIISLGNVCRWLATQAENLGVEIYPGFAAKDIIFDDNNQVCGIITGDMGVDKQGQPTANFQPGMELRGKYTLFAEGCRGSLSERLCEKFNLREHCDPQTYGIGIKELWEVDPKVHELGKVTHTVGWPLDNKTYGGSFIYHLENHQVAVGFVIGLDYTNPYLSPYDEFQRFKLHPKIKPLFENGRRVSYGARALNEGGYQSIPKLHFPGGMLIGCSAGFVNVPKIKGNHTAMKSGMVAAENVHHALTNNGPADLDLNKALQATWVWDELYKVRNIRPGFHKGLWLGLGYAAIDTYLLRGRAPWTFANHADHTCLQPTANAIKINYPKPDGKITFDKLSSVYISNTNHEENQPCHLTLKDPEVPIKINLATYAAPEQRYCPANVYEIVDTDGKPRLQINASNCVHCKTCDIKDPTQNIVWVTPEGGGGPNYPNM